MFFLTHEINQRLKLIDINMSNPENKFLYGSRTTGQIEYKINDLRYQIFRQGSSEIKNSKFLLNQYCELSNNNLIFALYKVFYFNKNTHIDPSFDWRMVAYKYIFDFDGDLNELDNIIFYLKLTINFFSSNIESKIGYTSNNFNFLEKKFNKLRIATNLSEKENLKLLNFI